MDASLYLRACLPPLLLFLGVVFELLISQSDDEAAKPCPCSSPSVTTAAAVAGADAAGAPVAVPFFIAGAVVETLLSTGCEAGRSLACVSVFFDRC